MIRSVLPASSSRGRMLDLADGVMVKLGRRRPARDSVALGDGTSPGSADTASAAEVASEKWGELFRSNPPL